MDANKLIKLRLIGYEISRACGLCVNGDFNHGSDWGTCSENQYTHEKHVGEPRQLSINRYGSCGKYEYDPTYDQGLHAYKEFLLP